MKYAFMTVLFAVFATQAVAQEYEVRSEFMYCKLNEGETLKDALNDSKRYGEFSKAAGTKYMQAILTPMHAGNAADSDY